MGNTVSDLTPMIRADTLSEHGYEYDQSISDDECIVKKLKDNTLYYTRIIKRTYKQTVNGGDKLSQLNCKNVVCYCDYFKDHDFFYFLRPLENQPFNSLHSVIKRNKKLQQLAKEKEILQIFLRAARGLYYLHSKGIHHNYLTPRSIIISNKDILIDGYMLPDFCYTYIKIKKRQKFEAPEREESDKKDVYSLGATILSYATNYRMKLPVSGISSGLNHCIEICLRKDVNKRPTMKEIYHRLGMIGIGVDGIVVKLKKHMDNPKYEIFHRIRYLCRHSKHNLKKVLKSDILPLMIQSFHKTDLPSSSLIILLLFEIFKTKNSVLEKYLNDVYDICFTFIKYNKLYGGKIGISFLNLLCQYGSVYSNPVILKCNEDISYIVNYIRDFKSDKQLLHSSLSVLFYMTFYQGNVIPFLNCKGLDVIMKLFSESIENKDDDSLIYILNIILHTNRYQYGKDMLKEKIEEFSYLSINFISKYTKDSPIVHLYQNVKEKLTPKEELKIDDIIY